MINIEKYYLILVLVQLAHSQEEIWNGFEKVWPLWKMSRFTFVFFEILLSILIIGIYLIKSLPNREILMLSFNVLMFANGIWHLMWAGIKKHYVPGLFTAPVMIIVFLVFYFKIYG
jgi:hypothetical protein